jgi:hypothetical protein
VRVRLCVHACVYACARVCVCVRARACARACACQLCLCPWGVRRVRWVALGGTVCVCAPVRPWRAFGAHMSPVPLGSHLIRRRSRLRAWQAVREVFARVDVDRGGTLDIDEVEEAAEL